jgi:hypothetical protein
LSHEHRHRQSNTKHQRQYRVDPRDECGGSGSRRNSRERKHDKIHDDINDNAIDQAGEDRPPVSSVAAM